jgi:Family of unknown function (DUF6220)
LPQQSGAYDPEGDSWVIGGNLVVRAARYTYAGLAWGLVAAIILQVFFIGLGLFVDSENLKLHENFGWILHLAPSVILLAAAIASAGRRAILVAAALAILVWIVPILVAVRKDLPLVAAFHRCSQ